jgi:hypothetical protein
MSDSGRNNNVDNNKAESSSGSGQRAPSPEARTEIRAAEAKVAWGIKYLYAMAHPYADKHYDAQGVATVTLEPETFNNQVNTPFGPYRLGDLFPNGLANGVTIQFFDKGYVRHPAAFYMVQQKIRSLCNAAQLPPANIDDAILVAQEMEGRVRVELDKKILAIKTDKQIYPSDKEKYAAKDAAFHKAVDETMKEASYYTAKKLYEKYLETARINSLDFADFSNQLLDTSAHHRTDKHDILTFNTETQHFSYDEAAKVTAHDRAIGNGCANLSIAIEGNYAEIEKDNGLIKTQVSNSLVKHASPVAIDDIGNHDIPEINLIVDASTNMLEIANTMARLRLHGRRPEDRNKPMKIDWVYQILTTNAGNDENQATAYGYITRAARLLNHSHFQLGEMPVSLDVSVLNAGINKLAGIGSVPKVFKLFSKVIQKSDTQRRENRHAYRQLTNAVATIDVDPKQVIGNESMQVSLANSINRLKSMLMATPQMNEATAIKIYQDIATVNQKIATNSQQFVNLREEYPRLKTRRESLIISLKALEEGKPSMTKNNMMIELNQDIQNINARMSAIPIPSELEACDAQAAANYDEMVVLSNLSDKHQRERWKINYPYVRAEVNQLQQFLRQNNDEIQARLNNPDTAEETTNQMQSICALIYKSYADELYFGNGEKKYAEVYRTPEKAALFNAYLILFQYLTPEMTASSGCKSGNDRTLLMRMLVAGLADIKGIPPALHDKPLAESNFTKHLSEMVMTISAVFATLSDTQGATPKVDESKFPYMAGVENIKTVSHFGKYAPHKMKITAPKAAVQIYASTDKSKHSLSGKAAFYQARQSSMSSGVDVDVEQKETSQSKQRPRSPSNSNSQGTE